MLLLNLRMRHDNRRRPVETPSAFNLGTSLWGL